jgi:ribosomal protein S18 acetylase RimI-like enzyme
MYVLDSIVVGTKLWSGKYLEIDNFIVHPEHRKKRIGKMITEAAHEKFTKDTDNFLSR